MAKESLPVLHTASDMIVDYDACSLCQPEEPHKTGVNRQRNEMTRIPITVSIHGEVGWSSVIRMRVCSHPTWVVQCSR